MTPERVIETFKLNTPESAGTFLKKIESSIFETTGSLESFEQKHHSWSEAVATSLFPMFAATEEHPMRVLLIQSLVARDRYSRNLNAHFAETVLLQRQPPMSATSYRSSRP